jgi:hypothetical protein
MDFPHTDAPAAPAASPDAIEFVRFCYRRKRVGWPELYDEMCAVASRGLFRGYAADDLAGIGIGFCLGDMPGLAAIVHHVLREEAAARKPVAVRIVPGGAGEVGGSATTREVEPKHEEPRAALRELRVASVGA